MRSTQWKTEISTVTDTKTIGEIRQWLARNGQIIPSRDADAVAKYLHLAVIANNRWGGVPLPLVIKRPKPVYQPWEQGYEGEGSRHRLQSASLDSWQKQLAQGAFGLLILLALFVAFRG